MRRARATYQGAYHHIMNRGIRDIDIFSDMELRDNFIKLLGEKSGKLKIKLLAYCLMNNHYHLILQNSSNKLSEFMKQLNGHFGIIYSKTAGSKGYVFQGRYKSTLIQEGAYLQMAIAYVLLNPVRAGIADNPYKYKWSSITDYYSSGDSIVDKEFVEDLFQSREVLNEFLEDWSGKDIPVRNTRFGKLICDEGYIDKAIQKFNRRNKNKETKRRRKNDYILQPVEKVIEEYEENKKIKISQIDVNSLKGKKLRSELLVYLKDRTGLKYSEIIKYPLFQTLKLSSLGKTYKRAKKRLRKEG